MKRIFKGYYNLSDKSIKSIWSNGFISFDTNVLFNLYRYSDNTRNKLLDIIQNYSDQIWLTYHAAYEFHKNRLIVIEEQLKIYEDTIKSFDKIENDIIVNSKSPHLSDSLIKNFRKTIKTIKRDLDKRKNFYDRLLTNDFILSKITRIFNNKIGQPLSKEQYQKFEKEGEERYKLKIPPGYKDNSKYINKYGDLIIWKELIQKSKEVNKPFIFVMDDVKEDWWSKHSGKTLFPRPELSQELFDQANQSFYLYTTDRFLEYASKKQRIRKDVIEETRDLRIDYLSFLDSPTLGQTAYTNPTNIYGIKGPIGTTRPFEFAPSGSTGPIFTTFGSTGPGQPTAGSFAPDINKDIFTLNYDDFMKRIINEKKDEDLNK